MVIKSVCCSCREPELGSHSFLASYNPLTPISGHQTASSSLFPGHLNSCGHTHIIINKKNKHKPQDDNYYQYSPTTHWLTDFDAQDQIHGTQQLEKSSITGLIPSWTPNLLKKNTEGFSRQLIFTSCIVWFPLLNHQSSPPWQISGIKECTKEKK